MEKLTIIYLVLSICILILPLIFNIILVLKRKVVYEIMYVPEYRELHIYKNRERIRIINTTDIEEAKSFVKKDIDSYSYDKYITFVIKINYEEKKKM